MDRRSGRPWGGASFVALGAAAVTVACCAGFGALTAAVGGLALAAVLGIGAGVAALLVGAVLVMRFLRSRERRRCDSKERA